MAYLLYDRVRLGICNEQPGRFIVRHVCSSSRRTVNRVVRTGIYQDLGNDITGFGAHDIPKFFF